MLYKRCFLTSMVLFFLIVLLACSKPDPLVGVYVCERTRDRLFFEIKPNGICVKKAPDAQHKGQMHETTGTYVVDGNKINCKWDNGGKNQYITEGNDLMSGGMLWERQGPDGSTKSSLQPDKLHRNKALTAVSIWLASKCREANVTLSGIQEIPTENSAKADVQFTNFRFNGSFSEEVHNGPGVAIFSHYNDGRWVLKKVQWATPRDNYTVETDIKAGTDIKID